MLLISTSHHSHSLFSSLSRTDCPKGPFHPALDGRHHYFEDEAPVQWAPVSNNFNQWISVGTPDDAGPTPCVDYGDLNHWQAPSWGLDASAASSKLRLLCCDEAASFPKAKVVAWVSTDEASLPEEATAGPVSPVATAGAPSFKSQSIAVESAQDAELAEARKSEFHSGLGSYTSHPELHSEESINAMIKILNPWWYNQESGWSGGSYHDAIDFCLGKHQELCPYAACESLKFVCPQF